jgi:hypothetical protein
MRPGDASLGGERRVLGGSFQSPRSDGRTVGAAAGEAFEGAVTPEVLTKSPGRRPGPTNWERGSGLSKYSERPTGDIPRTILLRAAVYKGRHLLYRLFLSWR